MIIIINHNAYQYLLKTEVWKKIDYIDKDGHQQWLNTEVFLEMYTPWASLGQKWFLWSQGHQMLSTTQFGQRMADSKHSSIKNRAQWWF